MRNMALPIALLLTAPAGAVAQEGMDGWSYAPLEDDIHLSRFLDHDVQSRDDRHIGQVRDILIGEDGVFEAVIVAFDHAGTDAQAVASLDWPGLDPREDAFTVGIGQQADEASVANQAPANRLGARTLIGMPVLLEGEAFGNVVDILVDREAQQPSALLVEADTGDRYALPLIRSAIDPAGTRVSYAFTRDEVLALGVFNGTSPSRR